MITGRNNNSYARQVYATEICIYDNHEIEVDGAEKIIEYCNDRIRLSLGKSDVCITGADLSIKNLSYKSVIINGCISGIEFFGGI